MSSPPLLSDEGMSRVRRKKDFSHMDRVDGRALNLLQGLELHTAVFSPDEQRAIVACVLDLQDQGRRGLWPPSRADLLGAAQVDAREGPRDDPVRLLLQLRHRQGQQPAGHRAGPLRRRRPAAAAPRRHGPPPRALARTPARLRARQLHRQRLRRRRLHPAPRRQPRLPPPLLLFCTASFLAECDIVFGRDLRVLGPGEFGGAGSTAINLPAGSVLVLNGNGADVAKHCVPAVPAKRISIAFRKMVPSKVPFGFTPDTLLRNLAAAAPPAVRPAMTSTSPHQNTGAPEEQSQSPGGVPFSLSTDEFPGLGAAASRPAVWPAMTSPPPQTPQNTGAAAAQRWRVATRAATPKQQQQAAAPQNNNQAAAVTARQSPSGLPFSLSTDEFPTLGVSPASGRRPGRR